ncbi:hypothetical protein KKF84_12660 [Myxococcota bacterium]|nr:hypothetical protein [Myxococcota bacterium]MBU1536167.1 hypothetical protein [Myxococcota bacterium]
MKSLSFLIILALAGCASGQIYEPSRTFTPTNAREINDEDIKKAYMAKPQMLLPAALAFYNLTSDEREFEKGLSILPHVKSFYKIPSILVEGIPGSSRYSRYEPKPAVSLKKLRLLGARAHADLLLIFSGTAHSEVSANPWVISSVLLITPLFVPMYDIKVTMKVNVWLMDIRNGYLYKEISLSFSGEESYLTLYGIDKARDRILKNLRGEYFPQVYKELAKSMASGVIQAPRECPACPAKTPETPVKTPAKL